MSIASEITRLQSAKASLKTSIENKGVTVPSSTKLDGYASLVDQIRGGTTEVEENDVNFYDYDGTRIASYTISQAKALTALPTVPTHTGLTFQEWNWSLADIQGYNRRYIDIGANYITNDEKTHLKVELVDELDTNIYIQFKGTVTVDWGDGTTADSQTTITLVGKKFTHTYAVFGKYDISISFTGDSGDKYGFMYKANTNDYWKSNLVINEVNCGKNLTFAYTQCFAYNQNPCIISVATDTTFTEGGSFAQSIIANLTVPKTFGAFSGIIALYAPINFCFPKQVTSFLGTNAFNAVYSNRIVLPEFTTGTPHTGAISTLRITRTLSIPDSWNGNVGTAVMEYDIVNGWIPSVSLTMNNANMLATNIVDFFNKLGDRSSQSGTLTLTFGSANLDKLTEEEKAIATNKGYTLA